MSRGGVGNFSAQRRGAPLRCALLLAGLALVGLRAAAAPVAIALDWHGGQAGTRPALVHIEALRLAGAGASAQPLQAEAPAEGVTLDLYPGVWQLRASTPGYWSQQAEVSVTAQGTASVRLALWPAAVLEGVIAASRGEAAPAAVEVRLDAVSPPASGAAATAPAPDQLLSAPVSAPASAPASAELLCPVQAARWSCEGPAGLFNVRAQVQGYAPRYAWGMRLAPSRRTDFGRLELRQAASIVGRAVNGDGAAPPGPCRASLAVDQERRGAEEADAAAAPIPANLFAPLSRDGFFQLVGMSPGSYMLHVDCAAASGMVRVRVQPDTETRVDPPLRLGDLTLAISLTPKLAPDGHPWRLTLQQTSPFAQRIATAATPSPQGQWTRRGLMAGNYHLVVSGPAGATWLQQAFDLGPHSEPLALRLASIPVAGRVLLGSQAVAARLDFSANDGGQSATLTSDPEGHFQGVLPVAADHQDSSWTVVAHVTKPPVSRTLPDVEVSPAAAGARSWLELKIPAIAVRGTVVSSTGEPQPQTQVIFTDAGGNQSTTATDEQGRFEMPDLPAGKYTAQAQSFQGDSDRVAFDVETGSGRELKLVLHANDSTPLVVTSSQGPVANATVQVWVAPGVPWSTSRTDQQGRLEMKLPPRTTEVALTIAAPRYFAVKLTRLRTPTSSGEPADAQTVTLDTAAGTLLLNLQPAGNNPDAIAPQYLVHNGALQDARALAGWFKSGQNTGSGNGQTVLPGMEPGDYALCSAADPAQLAELWSGTLSSNRCSSGTLDDGETLTLSAH